MSGETTHSITTTVLLQLLTGAQAGLYPFVTGTVVGSALLAVFGMVIFFVVTRKKIAFYTTIFSLAAVYSLFSQTQASSAIADIFIVLAGVLLLEVLRSLRTYVTNPRSIDIPLFTGYLFSLLTVWAIVFPNAAVLSTVPLVYLPLILGIGLIGWFYAFSKVTHPVRNVFWWMMAMLTLLFLTFTAGKGILVLPLSALDAAFVLMPLLIVLGLYFLYLALELSVSNKNEIDSTPEIERLKASDQLKDEYVAMLAHEIRTPLAGITGITELLIDGAEGDLSKEVVNNLELISGSSKRLTYLLNELLDISRIQENLLDYNPRPVHLRSVVNRVLALQYSKASTKGIQLRNQVPKTAPNVMADSDKLEQVLHNLINNSVKFTEEGYVSVDADVQDGRVFITIEDTGQGLSKEHIDRILDSFDEDLSKPLPSRTGSGLGLKITHKLVKLMGGDLTLESAQGFGSYVGFSVPVTEAEAEVDDTYENYSIRRRNQAVPLTRILPHRNAHIGDKFKVMIVDDEPVNIKVLTAQLNRAGYDVISFHHGRDALDYLNVEKIPDLILLDVMMPNLNGFEVCKIIREEYSQTELPVILLTAKSQTTDVLQGFKHGANDYIAKPIAKDELLARIKTHLELSKINHAFSRFVPHEFLKFLGYESILDIKLGDQVQKNMAVMFTDIKDFTRLSENMSPKEAFDFINTFLGVVSPMIRQSGGFIDKFIGDAVMALFPGGADDALGAAIKISEELKKLNIERKKLDMEPILIGTGLHSGDLMLGMIGEQLRMEGTVISDVVNTASRLEGLTKIFDSNVIISSDILDGMSYTNLYHFRYLGKTRVKGKNNVLDVYGVIEGDDPLKMKLEKASADAFEAGIKEFYDKNFTRASVHFNEVLKIHPNDKAASIFLKRSAHLMVTGVADDWSGVDEGTYIMEQNQ
ncbi:MAG: response regulator [Balneolales bacterium]|nr:response regulator [Balneolales bacterium]